MAAESDAAQAAQADALMKEVPKITDAAKNMFTVLLAECFADATALHACSKVVLQSITAHEMLDTPQWGLEHPQGEQQAATARIEQLGEYKVRYTVWKTAKASGSRPTKLLGRSWLRSVWADIEPSVLTDVRKAEMDALHGEGLFAEYVTRFRTELEDDGSMFWVSDFDRVLRSKAAERQARAAARLKAQEEAEKALAAELKAGLTGEGVAAEAGDDEEGPTVEEIAVPECEPEPEPEPEPGPGPDGDR